ncbi:hypothetical protein [Bradyrhizobium canariense]|uniref:hypothetical protein n=1 Tax=Bradyrhizobium canariense TaxID=255045 RepID=UPI000A18F6C4|nr:hypothetical protein [Bradyrhizobium canariense]OSI32776.1 hypothetical protein BST65_03710 [Bradyrhizobium canariense]OSI36856.1 hypothetical protein BST66_05305 [Bradyrhizobium canariense]OSI49973.1 hypothetical protein BSZ20_06300 [Bradyrhizobium canariense]OSI55577.1 hypothetical protein BST67_04905 [Bradyrhizobium canariense]OSI58980.1 hypothetical protein BSZ15_07140 [Bradyrhizobium canariense]
MAKAESERTIQALATTWYDTLAEERREHPSFSEFKTWLSNNHYSHYLHFRSRMGADYDAEMWFDDELGQNWRR